MDFGGRGGFPLRRLTASCLAALRVCRHKQAIEASRPCVGPNRGMGGRAMLRRIKGSIIDSGHVPHRSMSLAMVFSRSLDGLKAPQVTVEVHLANGLPSFTLVGLADTEVKEARERVRAALSNSGLDFPFNKRITVNLAPADLPKESGRFDLPIALGILAAMGHVDAAKLAELEFAGELSLGGEMRPVRGALPMALALRREAGSGRQRGLLLPMASAAEAALVDGVKLYGATHLMDVVEALRPDGQGSGADLVRMQANAVQDASDKTLPDLRDVRGQSAAKRALEVAAAGGHSLLMVGPPGTGKSMLAQRFAGLLPPLSEDEALESAAVLSLAGMFDARAWRKRLVRSPHHTASSVALVGGGVNSNYRDDCPAKNATRVDLGLSHCWHRAHAVFQRASSGTVASQMD